MKILPQRPPMVMIDHMIMCEGPVAKAALSVSENNVFVREGHFSESGMIEALAQTAAARTGYLIQMGEGNEDRKIPIGVIGSIKDFKLNFLPEVNDTIETEIEVTFDFGNASVVSGKVFVEGKEACSAELKIFLTDDNQQ